MLNNARSFLDLYQASQNDAKLTATRIQFLHKKANVQIKQALQPFGFYQATIKKELTKTNSRWKAVYQIKKGLAIRLNSVIFEISGNGKHEKSFIDQKTSIGLKSGDILNQSLYESIKVKMEKNALAEGYLKAKFGKSEIRVDLDKYQADIYLHFETGSQYLFGEVSFVQLGEQLDEVFLRRYLSFKSGDTYNTAALIHLQTTLSDSDYFTRIEINPLFDKSQDLKVPLEINITPRKPRKYRFGLGYGTDSGRRASVEHQRRVSPKGHVLTLKAKTSQRINRIDMQYMMPLKRPASDQFTLSSYFLRQVTESRRTTAIALDFRLINSLKRWRQTLALTYEREGYEIANATDSTQLLMPNINWTRSVYNHRIYPRRGNRLMAEVWLSRKAWFSDVNFEQLRLSGKWIFPLLAKGRFIFRLNAAGTLIADVENLPASKRFFAGGDQSIRGYAYEELGPLNAEGETIGGKYLAVASGEYEYRISGRWGLAVFYDAGNSFNFFEETIYRGYGFGVRWRSLVGPVRLDLGWPVNKRVDYPRLHLVIGLDL